MNMPSNKKQGNDQHQNEIQYEFKVEYDQVDPSNYQMQEQNWWIPNSVTVTITSQHL